MCKLLFSGGAFVAVYEAKDSLTHFDEVRARFDGAGISCLEELPIEVQVVGVGDATGPWRHDNQPRSQEERSEEHTSELQSLMRISYAVFCLKKKKNTNKGQSRMRATYCVYEQKVKEI